MIIDKLATLGIIAPASSADAAGLARDAVAARPAGAVRVAAADSRRLGVHAAISVPGYRRRSRRSRAAGAGGSRR